MNTPSNIDPAVLARVVAARDARLRAANVEKNVPIPQAKERQPAFDTEDLVMEAGANAAPEAHAAAERFRSQRADEIRPETVSARDVDARAMTWAPASILPHIPDRDGWHFRWIRLSTFGDADDLNMNQSLREGYVLATVEDVGNIHLSSDRSVRFPGGIEVGGLVLCKIPEEMRLARERYYHEQAVAQVTSVNNDMLRENDPRMPMLRPSNNSRTTFGVGRGQV